MRLNYQFSRNNLAKKADQNDPMIGLIAVCMWGLYLRLTRGCLV